MKKKNDTTNFSDLTPQDEPQVNSENSSWKPHMKVKSSKDQAVDWQRELLAKMYPTKQSAEEAPPSEVESEAQAPLRTEENPYALEVVDPRSGQEQPVRNAYSDAYSDTTPEDIETGGEAYSRLAKPKTREEKEMGSPRRVYRKMPGSGEANVGSGDGPRMRKLGQDYASGDDEGSRLVSEKINEKAPAEDEKPKVLDALDRLFGDEIPQMSDEEMERIAAEQAIAARKAAQRAQEEAERAEAEAQAAAARAHEAAVAAQEKARSAQSAEEPQAAPAEKPKKTKKKVKPEAAQPKEQPAQPARPAQSAPQAQPAQPATEGMPQSRRRRRNLLMDEEAVNNVWNMSGFFGDGAKKDAPAPQEEAPVEEPAETYEEEYEETEGFEEAPATYEEEYEETSEDASEEEYGEEEYEEDSDEDTEQYEEESEEDSEEYEEEDEEESEEYDESEDEDEEYEDEDEEYEEDNEEGPTATAAASLKKEPDSVRAQRARVRAATAGMNADEVHDQMKEMVEAAALAAEEARAAQADAEEEVNRIAAALQVAKAKADAAEEKAKNSTGSSSAKPGASQPAGDADAAARRRKRLMNFSDDEILQSTSGSRSFHLPASMMKGSTKTGAAPVDDKKLAQEAREKANRLQEELRLAEAALAKRERAVEEAKAVLAVTEEMAENADVEAYIAQGKILYQEVDNKTEAGKPDKLEENTVKRDDSSSQASLAARSAQRAKEEVPKQNKLRKEDIFVGGAMSSYEQELDAKRRKQRGTATSPIATTVVPPSPAQKTKFEEMSDEPAESPIPTAKKGPKVKNKTFGKLMKYTGPQMPYIIFSMAMTFVCVVAQLFIVMSIGNVIDNIREYKSMSSPGGHNMVILLFAAIIVVVVTQWASEAANAHVTYHIVRNIRTKAFNHLQHLPIRFLDSKKHGELINTVMTDVEQISDGLLMGFSQFFSGIVMIVCTILFMLYINWMLAGVVIILTPLSIWVAKEIAKRTHNMFSTQSKERADLSGFVEEMIGNQKTVIAFGHEALNIDQFNTMNDALEESARKAVFYSSITNPATRFVNGVVYAFIGIVGAFGGVFGWITIGEITAFLQYSKQYAKPFNEISGVLAEFQNALASAERVFELMETPAEEPEAKDTFVLTSPRGEVAWRNVNFSYESWKPLIKDFSMKAEPGQRVAIVGPTGCGKTTLINLLMRFYDAQSGSIEVDNRNITGMTKSSLRGNFGMVLQDTWIRSGTILENIAIGKPGATEEQVVEAAKAVHAHSFIRRMPQGYRTQVSEGGGNLSQGQRQLICIARVMLKHPPMLILDEATSSVDTRTETKIQEAFDKLMKGRTSIVVAHRLSTIRNADRIIVMKNGGIVEQGTHDELLEKGGFYSELFNAQYAAQIQMAKDAAVRAAADKAAREEREAKAKAELEAKEAAEAALAQQRARERAEAEAALAQQEAEERAAAEAAAAQAAEAAAQAAAEAPTSEPEAPANPLFDNDRWADTLDLNSSRAEESKAAVDDLQKAAEDAAKEMQNRWDDFGGSSFGKPASSSEEVDLNKLAEAAAAAALAQLNATTKPLTDDYDDYMGGPIHDDDDSMGGPIHDDDDSMGGPIHDDDDSMGGPIHDDDDTDGGAFGGPVNE